MLGDLSSAKGLKLICDVSESIKRELDILIVISLEAVEEVAKDTENIICGHLTKGQYGRVSALETSKLVWDWLSKVNEGVSSQSRGG